VKLIRKIRRLLFLFILLALSGIGIWIYNGIKPMGTPETKKIFVRYESETPLSTVLDELHTKGILRNVAVAGLIAKYTGFGDSVKAGSYSVGKGQNALAIIWSLRHSLHQTLRLPETNWANRTAHMLEMRQIVDADDYMELVHNPQAFANEVNFPLPKDSLEGYLYPGKYDLAPLVGAKHVIKLQLKEFEDKVWNAPDRPADLRRILILASLVQLESGKDEDRPMIAGIIENRLRQKMPLQIDATILYALQKWRRLTFKDYRNVKSPYNTYLVKGLPPGPICSPDAKDIEAAMHPTKHNYLYYLALPNGKTIYAATYKEHLQNIKILRAATKAEKAEKAEKR